MCRQIADECYFMRSEPRSRCRVNQWARVGLGTTLIILSSVMIPLRNATNVVLPAPSFTFNLTHSNPESDYICEMEQLLHDCTNDYAPTTWMWTNIFMFAYGLSMTFGLAVVLLIFLRSRYVDWAVTRRLLATDWINFTSPAVTTAVSTPFAVVAASMLNYQPTNVVEWCGAGLDMCRRNTAKLYTPSAELESAYRAMLDDTAQLYRAVLVVYAIIPLTMPVLFKCANVRKRCQRTERVYELVDSEVSETFLPDTQPLFGIILDSIYRPRKDELSLMELLEHLLGSDVPMIVITYTHVELSDEL